MRVNSAALEHEPAHWNFVLQDKPLLDKLQGREQNTSMPPFFFDLMVLNQILHPPAAVPLTCVEIISSSASLFRNQLKLMKLIETSQSHQTKDTPWRSGGGGPR